MTTHTAGGSEQVVTKANVQAGEGLVAHVLIPLVLCAVLSLGMSVFLAFEYSDRNEWASNTGNFDAYKLSVTSAKSLTEVPAKEFATTPASAPEESTKTSAIPVQHH